VTEQADDFRRTIDRMTKAGLVHRPDCPAPLVLTTNIKRWAHRAIGRCVNCEAVGLVETDVTRETSTDLLS
jgi:hypothetical protein